MANFTRISESGQIEIDWNMLQIENNVTDEMLVKIQDAVNVYLNNTNESYEIVQVEVFDQMISIRMKDERYHGEHLLSGSYVRIVADCSSGFLRSNFFTHYDMLQFGYDKVKGDK